MDSPLDLSTILDNKDLYEYDYIYIHSWISYDHVPTGVGNSENHYFSRTITSSSSVLSQFLPLLLALLYLLQVFPHLINIPCGCQILKFFHLTEGFVLSTKSTIDDDWSSFLRNDV